MEGGGQLAETRIERQGQGGQQGVIGTVFQVARHALRASDHVAVGEHNPLRLAGAARGVENSDNVGVDDAMPRSFWYRQQFPPTQIRDRAACRQRFRRVKNNNMAQVMALRQSISKQGKALGRGYQYPHVAVAHDVADLFGLQQRIQRHKDSAGRRCPETGDHRFETLLKVDGDALSALDAQ